MVAVIASILFVLGTLLLLVYLIYSHRSKSVRRATRNQLELIPHRETRTKGLLRKFAFVLLALYFSSGGIALLAKHGYLPYVRIEGKLYGAPLEFSKVECLVLLFGEGPCAIKFTTVDKDGVFRFKGLARRKYRMVAMRYGTNAFDLQEFSRDLRDGDFWSPECLIKEQLSMDKYAVAGAIKCFFDTGKSDLDSNAEKEIDHLLSNLPSGSYRLIVFGHADEIGGQSRNFTLSDKRTRSAFSALTPRANGQKAILAFFGSERPAAFGNSAQALSENRRAEVFVVVRTKELAK